MLISFNFLNEDGKGLPEKETSFKPATTDKAMHAVCNVKPPHFKAVQGAELKSYRKKKTDNYSFSAQNVTNQTTMAKRLYQCQAASTSLHINTVRELLTVIYFFNSTGYSINSEMVYRDQKLRWKNNWRGTPDTSCSSCQPLAGQIIRHCFISTQLIVVVGKADAV